MSVAEKLIEAKPEERPQTADVRPFFRSQPRSTKEVQQLVASAPVRSISESIAAAKAMFSPEYTRNKIRLAYASLGEEQRRMICFCSGLQQRHISMAFDEFSEEEAQAIGLGLKKMADVVRRFENVAGPVHRLTPAEFR
ncbi:hypothetical protein NF212_16065 [Parasalinivibrio latis]|uniref:hypothetical protein n=1 Tax=Parasalinivibrio latis TaxID=2952610 RepID=UPI0030E5E3B5